MNVKKSLQLVLMVGLLTISSFSVYASNTDNEYLEIDYNQKVEPIASTDKEYPTPDEVLSDIKEKFDYSENKKLKDNELLGIASYISDVYDCRVGIVDEENYNKSRREADSLEEFINYVYYIVTMEPTLEKIEVVNTPSDNKSYEIDPDVTVTYKLFVNTYLTVESDITVSGASGPLQIVDTDSVRAYVHGWTTGVECDDLYGKHFNERSSSVDVKSKYNIENSVGWNNLEISQTGTFETTFTHYIENGGIALNVNTKKIY